MSLSKVKASLVVALMVAGIALPVWQQSRLKTAQAEIAQGHALKVELSALREELDRARTNKADPAELERLRQWQAQTQPELLRLRGMVGVARRANAEAAELQAQLLRQSSESGSNQVAGPMGELMRHAMEQQSSSQLARMKASLHLTPDQARAAGDILKRQAQLSSAGVQQVFSGKFSKDELTKLAKDAGNPEEQIKALLTPEQLAGYKAYQQEETAHNARLAAHNELLQMQSTLGLTAEQQDRVFGVLYEVTCNQLNGATTPAFADSSEQMQWVCDQKAKALEPVLSATQLASYRQQQEIQLKFLKEIVAKMQGSEGEGKP